MLSIFYFESSVSNVALLIRNGPASLTVSGYVSNALASIVDLAFILGMLENIFSALLLI